MLKIKRETDLGGEYLSLQRWTKFRKLPYRLKWAS